MNKRVFMRILGLKSCTLPEKVLLGSIECYGFVVLWERQEIFTPQNSDKNDTVNSVDLTLRGFEKLYKYAN